MSNQKPWLILTSISLILFASGGTSLEARDEFQDKGEAKPAPKLIDGATQDAIDAGLEFLAKNQQANGSWGTGMHQGSIAHTSLAGLALLAGGHKPGEGKYGKNIALALNYVLDREDPDRPGFLKDPSALHGRMYGHGFGTHFLAEAHSMVNEPKLRTKLDATLSRAVKLLIDTQSNQGGWRYEPIRADADMTVTIVQIMALHAAGKAGVEIPKVVKEKYVKYAKECQDAKSGGFAYRPTAVLRHGPGFACTAAGLLALQSAGESDCAEVKNGLDFLKKFQPPAIKDFQTDPEYRLHYFYGHYYAVQAMQIAGGDRWRDWYTTIRDDLVTNGKYRQKDGSWAQLPHFGPDYCTAMALLILQTPQKSSKGDGNPK